MGRIGKRRGLGRGKRQKQKANDLTLRVFTLQRDAFRKKFGRDPKPDDPIFFDPDKDVPTPITNAAFDADVMKALAGIAPQFAYAYQKTGLILMEGNTYPPEVVAEYNAAIDEFFRLYEDDE